VELHGFRFITDPKFFMFLAHQRAHVFEDAQPQHATLASVSAFAAASSGPVSAAVMVPKLVPRPVLQKSGSARFVDLLRSRRILHAMLLYRWSVDDTPINEVLVRAGACRCDHWRMWRNEQLCPLMTVPSARAFGREARQRYDAGGCVSRHANAS
jgi:hypothetical protein